MLLLKELIDFLLLLRSPAAMRICVTHKHYQQLNVQKILLSRIISLSLSVCLSFANSLPRSLTHFPFNQHSWLCLCAADTDESKDEKKKGLAHFSCADSRDIKGCKSVLNVSSADEWGAEMSTEILLGLFHFISHLSIPSKNRLKLFLCWSQAAANEVQS